MGYEIELSERAAQRLRGYEPSERGQVVEHLYRLAESPVALSTPAPSPPYIPGFQMHQFQIATDEAIVRFTVLFKYGADEQTIHVYSIGRVQANRSP